MVINMIFANYIEGAFFVHNKKGRVCKVKNRSLSGVVFVQDGKYIYHSDSKKVISDSNHIIFLPQGSSYEFECLEEDNSCVINFSDKLNLPESDIFSIQSKNNNKLIEIFYEMNTITAYDNQYKLLSLFYECMDILFSESKNPSDFPDIIAPSIKYINEHFCDNDINNDIIAKQSNISTVYFRKVFTASYGSSPMKYIKNMRIEKSQYLLKNKNMSISEIAIKCGFGSIYRFCDVFKKQMNCSPGEYASRFNSI